MVVSLFCVLLIVDPDVCVCVCVFVCVCVGGGGGGEGPNPSEKSRDYMFLGDAYIRPLKKQMYSLCKIN